MTVEQNYAVERRDLPDETTGTVNLDYTVSQLSDLSILFLRKDNGAVVSPSAAVLNPNMASVDVTNNTGADVEVIVKRESDLSQDFDPSNQTAIDVRSLESSQDKQTKAIQELKLRDDLVTSIDGFTVPSRFARALKYIKFDANGALTLVDGVAWTDITGKPDYFPTEWGQIDNKPDTFPPSAHTHPWGQITGKPTTFPPSAHDHAGDNLGRTDGDGTENRVQTLAARYINLDAAYEARLGNMRIMPENGGQTYRIEIWDAVEEEWVIIWQTYYDEDADTPAATIVNRTVGSLDVGLNLRFGNQDFPLVDKAPYIRANDTVAGEPFENDVLQLYFDGTPQWTISSSYFLSLDPNATLGKAGAPIGTVFTDRVSFGDGKIRTATDNIEFLFPNESEVDEVVWTMNHGGLFVGEGRTVNIASTDDPVETIYANNLVVNTSATFPDSLTFEDLELSGTLDVTGATTLGNASLSGTLGVTGLATFGNIKVTEMRDGNGEAWIKRTDNVEDGFSVVIGDVDDNAGNGTRLTINDDGEKIVANKDFEAPTVTTTGNITAGGNASVTGTLVVTGTSTFASANASSLNVTGVSSFLSEVQAEDNLVCLGTVDADTVDTANLRATEVLEQRPTLTVVSSTRTLLESESGQTIMAQAGVNLPSAPAMGTYYDIIRDNSGSNITISPSLGTIQDGSSNLLGIILTANYTAIRLKYAKTNLWIIESVNGSTSHVI